METIDKKCGNSRGYYEITNAEGFKIQGTDKSLADRSNVHVGRWMKLVKEGNGSRQYAWDKAVGEYNSLWRSFCFNPFRTIS